MPPGVLFTSHLKESHASHAQTSCSFATCPLETLIWPSVAGTEALLSLSDPRSQRTGFLPPWELGGKWPASAKPDCLFIYLKLGLAKAELLSVWMLKLNWTKDSCYHWRGKETNGWWMVHDFNPSTGRAAAEARWMGFPRTRIRLRILMGSKANQLPTETSWLCSSCPSWLKPNTK